MRKAAPEFLLIDLGNTRLKWAAASGNRPIQVVGEISTKAATAGRIASLARKYHGSRIVMASVVPKLAAVIRRAFSGHIAMVAGDCRALALPFDYPNPTEIGADRLAAAVAVHSEGKFPAIIVACGTATAFTVLDAKGRLCGGAIAPGLQAQLDSLLGATAQLPATKLRPPGKALGKSTQEAIRAGVMLNFQGGVKEIIRQLSGSLPGGRPRLILTGGNADHLTQALDLPHTIRPLLVFEGLRIIGNRIWPSAS